MTVRSDVLNLVKLFIKVIKLSALGHHFFAHEEGSLKEIVLAFPQEIQSIIDQGLVQADTNVFQEVATVTTDFTATFSIETIQAVEDLVMWNDPFSSLFFRGHSLRNGTILEMGANNGIESLISTSDN